MSGSKTVKVRELVIGQGQPKICVPLVASQLADILQQAQVALALKCDLVEWRLDHFHAVADREQVLAVAKELRELLGQTPLLVTFRTLAEGGVREFSEAAYFQLYEALIQSGTIDLLDVEVFLPEAEVKATVALAHKHQVAVIMCNHDFDATPPYEELVRRLQLMAERGGDICKLAVMPQTSSDVLTLLQATNDEAKKPNARPLSTMAMGSLGLVSRLSGEVFGSAVTFGSGSGSESSAPGQIPVPVLQQALALFHSAD